MAKSVTDANFDEVYGDVPTLVYFWATWCGPCRQFSPLIDELSEELGDRAKVLKANVDEAQQSASSMGVMSVPTVMVFRNGQPERQLIGPQTKETLIEALGV